MSKNNQKTNHHPLNKNSPPTDLNMSRKRPRPLFDKQLSLSDVFSPPTPSKYVVIQRKGEAGEDLAFEQINTIKMRKSIQSIVKSSDLLDIKKLKNGTLLVKAVNDAQVDQLIKTSNIEQYHVLCYLHKQLNSSKGVINCLDLMINTVEEIKEELAAQGVIDVYRITSRKSGVPKPTPTLILTFSSQTMPTTVFIGFHKLNVREYVQNPLRCFKCQRFGHSKLHCKGVDICVSCGVEAHGDEACKSSVSCVNCKGNHSASSRDCPVWRKEKRIQEIIAKEHISITEAKKRCENIHQTVNQNLSFASAAASPSLKSELETLKKQNEDLTNTNKILLEKLASQAENMDKMQNSIDQLTKLLHSKLLPDIEPASNMEIETPLVDKQKQDVATFTAVKIPPTVKVKINRNKKESSALQQVQNKVTGASFYLKDKPTTEDDWTVVGINHTKNSKGDKT